MNRVSSLPPWDRPPDRLGFSPYTLAVPTELSEWARLLYRETFAAGTLEVGLTRSAVWWVLRREGIGGIAVRGVEAPGGVLVCLDTHCDDRGLTLTLQAENMGLFEAVLQWIDRDQPLWRWTVHLTPSIDLRMPPRPANLYPLDRSDRPHFTHGLVHAVQRDTAAGMLYFSVTEPPVGSMLYLEDLTSLNDYGRQTQTEPREVVTAAWPELGYRSPVSLRHPLEEGRPTCLNDALVTFTPDLPRSSRQSAQMFLDMLAQLYAQLRPPAWTDRPWPELARATLRDLTHSSKCWEKQNGRYYLHPYLSSEYPDSMVQLTVLSSVRDYEHWSGDDVELSHRLREGVEGFFDPELGVMRRYLATVGPDVDADEVDSWYLYHPLANLARLAATGDASARTMFLASVDFGIRVAHHFDYHWPIKFDLLSLKIHVGDREPGQGGQTDVPGLYAYVMLQAFDLTGERRYLQEAKAAIHSLDRMGFAVGYQFNNVAWGATACLRLFRLTGDVFFQRQAQVFLASFFHNVNLWECDLGPSEHYTTFMGVTCLHDGPYMAAYEEFEAFAAFHECLEVGGADLSPAMRLLMCEYCHHALNRLWFFYPGNLPREILATEIRNSHLDPSLAIPVEDLHASREPPGAVGQEVYGAGAALVLLTRSYHRLVDVPFDLFCSYPLREIERPDARSLRIRPWGEAGFAAFCRLIPHEGAMDGGFEPQIEIFSALRRRGEAVGAIDPPSQIAVTLAETRCEDATGPVRDWERGWPLTGAQRVLIRW